MAEDWLNRWSEGRTGWHESEGNAGLREYWQTDANRVLVPLCGKSPDLVWLARRGHEVVGVELAEIAIRDFFAEQGLEFDIDTSGVLDHYRCRSLPLSLYCGDYFEFDAGLFDALYDRGALVAVDPGMRARYVESTRKLLRPDAYLFLVAMEYDQSIVAGPPYALMPDELATYFSGLERLDETDDLDNCPPKFRAAGLREVSEVVWCRSG